MLNPSLQFLGKPNLMNKGILLIVFIACVGCSSQQSTEKTTYEYSFRVNQITLPLDKTSVARSNRFQSSQIGNKGQQLAFLNEIDNSIKIYQLDSINRLVKSIKLSVDDGPNSVGAKPTFFQILNNDSILVYADFTGGLVSLVDWEGQVLNKFNLPISENLKTNYFPAFNSSSPVFESSGSYIFPYSVSKVKDRGLSPILKYDPINDSTTYYLNSISKYDGINQKKIGGKEFFKSSLTYNTDKDEFVLSLPLDHRIFSFSRELKLLSSHVVKSQGFKKFKELKKDANEYSGDNPDFLYHRYGNSRYSAIVYDKWRKVYYRIMVRGYSENEIDLILNEGERIEAAFTIMALDSNFNLLLEHEISSDEKISYNEFFITKTGLAMKELTMKDEDIMNFKIFELHEN